MMLKTCLQKRKEIEKREDERKKRGRNRDRRKIFAGRKRADWARWKLGGIVGGKCALVKGIAH